MVFTCACTALDQERDQRWEYKGSWKETYASLVSHISSVSKAQNCLCVDHFYSDLLYQPYLCSVLDIDDAWLEEENVDRRHDLSLEEFRDKYEVPNIPVIITDVVAKWPAYKKWSREFLQSRFKGKDVLVGDVPMNFDSYLQYCDDQHDEMPLYLFDKYFCEKSPEMDNEYSVPVYFEEDLFSVLGKEERPDYRWLIYGPYKSGSTFHKDPNSTSAWNAVISGAKKWILYPPHVLPPGVLQSQDGADVASPVSLMEWMISFYDIRDSQGVKPYECVVKEGELLFVPHGWWHMVINVEESCAVTQNYVSRANLSHVLNFLKSPSAHVLVSGVKTDEEKLTLYDRFKKALEKLKPEIIAAITEKENKRKRDRQVRLDVYVCFFLSEYLNMIFVCLVTCVAEYLVCEKKLLQVVFHLPRLKQSR